MELARNIKVESVSRLRPAPALCLAPEQTVAEAVAIMRREHCGCVLICQDNRLQGIFTERDLLRRVLASGQSLDVKLARCMTRDPVAVQADGPLSTALRLMQEGGYRHLPVVDPADQPVGVLSVKRIVQYLAEHFPGTIFCQPPDPAAFPHQREGA